MNIPAHHARTGLAALLLASAPCLTSGDAASAQDAQIDAANAVAMSPGPSVQEIAATIAESRQAIGSLHVRHTNKSRFAGAPRQIQMTTTFKYRDGRAFVDTQEASANADQARPLNGERARLYFDGRTFYKLWRQDRIVFEYPIEKSSPFLLKQVYLDALAIWPFSSVGLNPVSSTVFYLPEALEHNAYVIVARRDASLGDSCTVLECRNVGPSHFEDRIWLDETKNWALRKRVTRAKPSPNRQDSLMVVVLDDCREMTPGIWMPWRIDTSQLRRLRGGADKFEPIANDTLVVDEMAVNCPIDESQFRPEYQPGSLIRRPDSGTESALPGGHDLLEAAAANLSQFVHGQGRQQSRPLARPIKAIRWILPVALLGTLAAGSCILVRRQKSSPPSHDLPVTR